MSYIHSNNDCIIIELRVLPNSSKNLLFIDDEILKLKITTPPIDNKANKFVINYLSKELKIPKSDIEIIRGATSKNKVISIKAQESAKIDFIYSYFSAL